MEMIEASLRERLTEVDPERSRRDGLGAERALRGLERIGAALVFSRKTTIANPDNEVDISEAQGQSRSTKCCRIGRLKTAGSC